MKPEPKKNDKPYISPSQLSMMARCPEQYRRRYIEKEIIPPGFAMLKGGAVHAGAEVNMKQKLETHKDLPIKDIIDAAAASFDGKVSTEGVLLNEDEESRGQKVVHGEAKDSVVRMATILATKVTPQYQPLAVEERVRLELPGRYDLLGIMDLVVAEGVQDIKTGAKAKNQDDIDSEVQFTVYAALHRAKYGKLPAKIIIDNIVDRMSPKTGKVTTEALQFLTTREDRHFDALAARINTMVDVLKAGVFMPAYPGAWWCSAKSCGYWRTCPYTTKTDKGGSENNG